MFNLFSIKYIIYECPNCHSRVCLLTGGLYDLKACPACHLELERATKNIIASLLEILKKQNDLTGIIMLEVEDANRT